MRKGKSERVTHYMSGKLFLKKALRLRFIKHKIQKNLGNTRRKEQIIFYDDLITNISCILKKHPITLTMC